jgi:hypothetical protein
LDPAGAAAGRVLLEPGRDQHPDPTPERVGVDVSLDAPGIASLAHHAVADDAVAVADDARVVVGLEFGPLVLQISLREPALPVQRRLERDDDLGHRRRVGGEGGCREGALHAAATLRHQRCPHSWFEAEADP